MARPLPSRELTDLTELHRQVSAHDDPDGRAGGVLQQTPPPVLRSGLLDNHDPQDARSEVETDPALMQSDHSLEEVRHENAELRQRAKELEEMVTEAWQKEQAREEQQKDFDAILEEKTAMIRQLHERLLELQDKPRPSTPREEELLALHEELEQERKQLTEDEEALMQQMRQMEVQMSRERAEIARQRNELQRLHNDIRHELELAAREAELRDRLQPLQRRHQEMTHRKAAEPYRDGQAQQPQNGAAAEPPAAKASEGGLLRRWFG